MTDEMDRQRREREEREHRERLDRQERERLDRVAQEEAERRRRLDEEEQERRRKLDEDEEVCLWTTFIAHWNIIATSGTSPTFEHRRGVLAKLVVATAVCYKCDIEL